jgi:hypothetical protein
VEAAAGATEVASIPFWAVDGLPADEAFDFHKDSKAWACKKTVRWCGLFQER